jgi:Zn-dependent M28 family amino/carboxypeptidase
MRRLTIVAVVLLTALLAPTPALAIDEVDTTRLRNAVTVGGILAHERIFQRIANQNGGTRASGTPGYDASADYVQRRLEAAGYQVTLQEFTFPFFDEVDSALQQTAPNQATYQTGAFTFSDSGDVTGTVVPIDLVIPATPAPSSTSGCEAADFPAPPAEPAIALIQRGTCTFEVKAANAQAAGYDAVIIFNEGNPGRQELFIGTLGRPFTIPVVGMSYTDALTIVAPARAGTLVMRVFAETVIDLERETVNVLADSPTGSADRVVVVGAHLDSVPAGPGINDNGSGTSTILEIAEEMAELGIRNRQQLRFAFWGAEESGLLGSEHYVDSLSEEELQSIVANLNFDMVGSPNYVRFVYDGDGNGAPGNPDGPPGSAQIEAMFNQYFASQGLPTEPTPFNGRSDYGPFIAVGIPAGGLFSGAEGIKTPEQAAIYGGTAGIAYDPCYHQACDDITNLSTRALHELGDGAAHAAMTLARTRTGFYEDGSFRTRARVGVSARRLPFSGPQAVN